MSKIKFDAVIEQHKSIDAAFVRIPFVVEEVFGTKGQVKIKACFDGKVEYRGSIANMGMGCHTLGITKEIRKKINKTFEKRFRLSSRGILKKELLQYQLMYMVN